MEQILLAVSDPMLVVDSQRRVEMLNRAAEGWRAGPYTKRKGDFTRRFTTSTLRLMLWPRRCRAGQERKQVALRTKAGEEVLVSDHITPLWGKKGKVLGVLCTFKQVGVQGEPVVPAGPALLRDALTGLTTADISAGTAQAGSP